MKKKHKLRRQASTAAATANATAPAPFHRIDVIDALRGFAILLMVAYHFCFDLDLFGVIHANFNEDRFWLTARTLIVSSFLTLAGASMVLAAQIGSQRSFLRRALILAICCIAVSAASYVMFPRSWIFFGVLHFILAASFLGRFFVRWHRQNLIIGLVLIAVGSWVEFSVFDHPSLQWFGLTTRKPITEDYVPLLPWFGVVLIGMFLAKTALNAKSPWLSWRPAHMPVRTAALAGRHSLAIYMVHQPLLVGIMYLWRLVSTGHF